MRIIWKCKNEYSTLLQGERVILKGKYNMLKGREEVSIATVKKITPTGMIRFEEFNSSSLFLRHIGSVVFPLKDPNVQETYRHLNLLDFCSDLVFRVFRDKQDFLNKASEEDLLKIKEVLERYEKDNSKQ